jgi:protein TonB
MKRNLTFIFFIFITVALSSQNQNTEPLKLDKPPIISGCNSKKSNEDIKACLTEKFQKRLNRKLRIDVFVKNLEKGKYIINTNFVISKKGNITDIKVNHENPNIVKEIKRALKKLKKFKPGILDNKPVNVPFSFPLHIEVY